ncbi:hypothetical protein AF47_04737 [Klebsiella aerogenes MGH 61]|nr:hypothetical protein AF47_04737 [Klebsiella aerogenes MGH 61]
MGQYNGRSKISEQLKYGSATDISISSTNRLDEFWPLVLHITNSARYGIPYEMISCHFFSLLARHVLFHPLPGSFRYQDKRSPVMYINEAVTIRNPSSSSLRSNMKIGWPSLRRMK